MVCAVAGNVSDIDAAKMALDVARVRHMYPNISYILPSYKL
jgi:hypothetical protein